MIHLIETSVMQAEVLINSALSQLIGGKSNLMGYNGIQMLTDETVESGIKLQQVPAKPVEAIYCLVVALRLSFMGVLGLLYLTVICSMQSYFGMMKFLFQCPLSNISFCPESEANLTGRSLVLHYDI